MYQWKYPEIRNSLAIQAEQTDTIIKGDKQELLCHFDVTGLAAESIAIAAHNISAYAAVENDLASVSVDRRLASFWFAWSIRPLGWQLPSPWDAIAGDYQAADGWIRLHTNHHKAAVIKVLDCVDKRETVAEKVAQWAADELESAVVDAGGCAARMRGLQEWQDHPQGRAVKAEPLAHFKTASQASKSQSKTDTDRPLQGIRILDLTRVLAGPVAGRFLAAYGAEVLRIDPPWWEEPGVIPEVTLGKRCAALDLNKSQDRKVFQSLLSSADVLLHGYRPGALAALGYDSQSRHAINPNLIDVSLSAYGSTGPWSKRRGFDSLVQMSSGISDYIMRKNGLDKPGSLPVQALDQATGYFLAAAAVKALYERRESGLVQSAKLSLARTAELLVGSKRDAVTGLGEFAEQTSDDLDSTIELTSWGQAQRLKFPVDIDGLKAEFERPASEIRTAKAAWLNN